LQPIEALVILQSSVDDSIRREQFDNFLAVPGWTCGIINKCGSQLGEYFGWDAQDLAGIDVIVLGRVEKALHHPLILLTSTMGAVTPFFALAAARAA